jgi:hypothetical protein
MSMQISQLASRAKTYEQPQAHWERLGTRITAV